MKDGTNIFDNRLVLSFFIWRECDFKTNQNKTKKITENTK
jgi:hypothetical protein